MSNTINTASAVDVTAFREAIEFRESFENLSRALDHLEMQSPSDEEREWYDRTRSALKPAETAFLSHTHCLYLKECDALFSETVTADLALRLAEERGADSLELQRARNRRDQAERQYQSFPYYQAHRNYMEETMPVYDHAEEHLPA